MTVKDGATRRVRAVGFLIRVFVTSLVIRLYVHEGHCWGREMWGLRLSVGGKIGRRDEYLALRKSYSE